MNQKRANDIGNKPAKTIWFIPVVQIWFSVTIIFTVCLLTGVVHGPWNYCWLFTLGCWAVLDIDWALTARHAQPPMPGRPNRLAPTAIGLVYALYCLPLSSVTLLGQRIVPRILWLEIFGAFACALGIGFAMWARYVLDASWNAEVRPKEGSQLVQHGPYTIVRHPIYFGFLLAVVGMIIALGEFRAFALAFGVEILLIKMGKEERGLRAKFPVEYPRYELGTKRLLPLIW